MITIAETLINKFLSKKKKKKIQSRTIPEQANKKYQLIDG